MRSLIPDVMAGQRARLIRETPGVPVLIHDPTDPRCGRPYALSGALMASGGAARTPVVRKPFATDPLDPRVGNQAR